MRYLCNCAACIRKRELEEESFEKSLNEMKISKEDKDQISKELTKILKWKDTTVGGGTKP